MSAPQDDVSVEASSSGTSPGSPAFKPSWKPRRYHNKSRHGCLSCKRRRIKCGEERPGCRNCWEKALDCTYPAVATSDSDRARQKPARLLSPASNWTSLSQSYILPASGEEGIIETKDFSAMESEPLRSDTQRLMDHFVANTNEVWLGDSIVPQSMQQWVVQASASRPYLLHTILAMSAAHISQTSTLDTTRYKYLSALHYQFSLGKYCEYLRTGIVASDTDAMFATCILLAMLTFSHVAEETPSSGLEGATNSMIWVRAMQGTKFLLESPQLYSTLRSGTWGLLVIEYDDFDDSAASKYLDSSPRRAKDLVLIEDIDAMCQSSDEDDQQAYTAGIRMLQDLVGLRPIPDVIGRFVFTLTRLPHNFYGMVGQGDARAVAIVGMWCALISRVQSWWVTSSAKVECGRIAAMLAAHGDVRFADVVLFLQACAES